MDAKNETSAFNKNMRIVSDGVRGQVLVKVNKLEIPRKLLNLRSHVAKLCRTRLLEGANILVTV